MIEVKSIERLEKYSLHIEEVPIKVWKFPTGEVGFKFLEPGKIKPSGATYEVNCKFESNDDIFAALQAIDALKILGVEIGKIILRVPYLPYSRQDRVCHPGESFALQVLASVLNTTGVDIHTLDVHSDVAMQEIPTLSNTEQFECVWNSLPHFDYFIAPDKGSHNKAKDILPVQDDGSNLVTLSKERIGSTIKYMDYEYDSIKGSACIVDDLCDGGGTFLACAEMLRRTQPNLTELSLYITHGFFTAGIDKLKEKFDNIYVCNLMSKDINVINFVKGI